MASVKQIEANRNNSKLSTGPKTVEGKLAVRLNALTHGLRTEALDVLPGERESVFENRLHAFNEVYAPRNEVESQLVRRAVVLSWKLERAERHENEVLTQQTFEFINACDCDDDDVPALSRAAALASFDPSPDGERIRRYQFAVERSCFRVLDKLAKVRGQEVHLKPEETTQAAAPINATTKVFLIGSSPLNSTVDQQFMPRRQPLCCRGWRGKRTRRQATIHHDCVCWPRPGACLQSW